MTSNITSNERRAIAEEMRQRMYEGYDFFSSIIGDEIGIKYEEYDDEERFSNDCWNRLADLIEPEPERTCKWNRSIGCGYCDGAYDSETDTFDSFPIVRHDFSCGHSAITESEKNIPHFCPECGARII